MNASTLAFSGYRNSIVAPPEDRVLLAQRDDAGASTTAASCGLRSWASTLTDS